MSIRASLVFVLALILVACDSGGPASLTSADLVGEWGLVSSDETTYVTVTTAQDVPDLSQPATSTLQITGEHQGTISHTWDYIYAPYDPSGTDSEIAKLLARDVEPGATGWQFAIEVNAGNGTDVYELDVMANTGSAESEWYFDEITSTSAVSFDRLGVTVDNVTLPAYRNASGSVTLDGRFAFATRRVEAGETLSTRTFFASRVDDDVEKVIFAEDGTYRLLFPPGEIETEQTGTWEIVGQSVRLTDSSGASTLYKADLSASSLRLSHEGEGSLSPFRGSLEDRPYLEPGTTSNIREENVIVLSR